MMKLLISMIVLVVILIPISKGVSYYTRKNRKEEEEKIDSEIKDIIDKFLLELDTDHFYDVVITNHVEETMKDKSLNYPRIRKLLMNNPKLELERKPRNSSKGKKGGTIEKWTIINVEQKTVVHEKS